MVGGQRRPYPDPANGGAKNRPQNRPTKVVTPPQVGGDSLSHGPEERRAASGARRLGEAGRARPYRVAGRGSEGKIVLEEEANLDLRPEVQKRSRG